MIFTYGLAELMGIMFGDGCLSRSGNKYIIYISGHKFDDVEYHDKVTRNLFLKVFDKVIKIQERKNENTLFIRFSDKNIFTELSNLGMPIGFKYRSLQLPYYIQEDKQLAFRFIRGLVDTDGSIVFSKQHQKIPYYPRIEISSKSHFFLENIFQILSCNGFYGSISAKKKIFRLELPGFKNLDRWCKLIGFNNPKHMKKIEAKIGPIRLESDSN